jgi:hypothetical protein
MARVNGQDVLIFGFDMAGKRYKVLPAKNRAGRSNRYRWRSVQDALHQLEKR